MSLTPKTLHSPTSHLIAHPTLPLLLSPLGATPTLTSSKTGDQKFLPPHTDQITALALSKKGKYVASGQKTFMGWKAGIQVVKLDQQGEIAEEWARFDLHKVSIQALAFSPSELYLASLGGQDDGSIVIWNLETKQAICGASGGKESSGNAFALAYSNTSDTQFITAGQETIRVWDLDIKNRKIKPTDVQTGQIKRVVKCIVVDDTDTFAYCGTTTGDVLQINIQNKMFRQAGPPRDKDKFSQGVGVIAITPDKQHLLLGCGDGTIAHMAIETMSIVKKTQVQGSVTSICFTDPLPIPEAMKPASPKRTNRSPVKPIDDTTFLASTSLGNMYILRVVDLVPTIKSTAHSSVVHDLAFPRDSSDVFATASATDIRIWVAADRKELLRILIPGLGCNVIEFKKDGHALLSGWTDGKIRAFGPETGKLQLEITDAHKDGAVTALSVCTDAYKIVSGGEDGQVRIWSISDTGNAWTLDASLKEHRGTVSCIRINANNTQAISSSQDGSCIIWDIVRHVRNQVIFASSFFKCVAYYPEESQVLTSGTDRKVGYWEVYDGTLIRELEASQSDSINSLDITRDGKFFVIGGSDKLVKVYNYEEGTLAYTGVGHSTDIQKVRISPDQKFIMSVSCEGAIFQWRFPVEVGPSLARI